MISLVGYAIPPNLACEELFSAKSLEAMKNDDVTIIVRKSAGDYYRNIQSAKYPQIISKIKQLIDIDEQKSSDSTFKKEGAEYSKVLIIKNNNKDIRIAFFWTEAGKINFLIQGSLEAFK